MAKVVKGISAVNILMVILIIACATIGMAAGSSDTTVCGIQCPARILLLIVLGMIELAALISSFWVLDRFEATPQGNFS